MTVALIVAGLAVYAAFLLWRVRVERGRTRRSFATELAAFTAAMDDLERALGEALLPSTRGTTTVATTATVTTSRTTVTTPASPPAPVPPAKTTATTTATSTTSTTPTPPPTTRKWPPPVHPKSHHPKQRGSVARYTPKKLPFTG